jgi:hypothetical protein
VGFRRADDLAHRRPQAGFTAWIPVNEILHVHPTPHARAAQAHRIAAAVHDPPTLNLQYVHDISPKKKDLTTKAQRRKKKGKKNKEITILV